MQEMEIQDYARQLLDAHGDKAQVEAAQKARAFEEKGNADEATTWRQIEAAIKLMRGPRES
jgi:regulator of protease activity HflC (stomatin/prohibitin superfamily)